MQDVIVYLIVAAAAFYLVRTVWSAFAGEKSGCNSCGSNCGSKQPSTQRTPQSQGLIKIDLNQSNGKR